MEHVRYGQSGSLVSTITYGCWELGGTQWELASDANSIEVLRTAFDHGITSFDTAEGYGNGHSEEITGQALKGMRSQIFLASKVSPKNLRAADVRQSVEASLKRLGTDYLDLCYMHWPNDEIPMEESMSAFMQLKQEGKIRSIGVSNFSLAHLQKAVQIGQVDALQSEYSLLQRDVEDGILPYCREHGIGFFSYSSLAKGLLTGAYHLGGAVLKADDFRSARRLFIPGHREQEWELIQALKAIADAKGVSMGNLAIAWLLHRPGMTSAIIGTQSVRHLLDNLNAVAISLTPDETATLTRASDRVLAQIAAIPVP